MFLPGSYQDPKNQIQILATDPSTLLSTDPRLIIPEEQLRAFESRRTGLLVGRELAEQHGWKVGDRIPIQSPAQRKDGAETWEFDIVGTYELDRKQTGRHVPALFAIMQFENYNEAVKWNNLVIWYTVRVRDVARAPAIAKAIDQSFRNSDYETRTQSEAAFQRGFVKQFGDVGKMMTAILGAVFFTLLLVAGNTMMQAFRERVPELAVLKTLGYSNGRVAALVGIESLLLCGLAGAVGLALAALVVPLVAANVNLGGLGGGLAVEDSTLAAGALLALGLGAVSALVPAWRSARLTVVDGLVQS
jgi:putative ABC transport system permease protein